MGSREQRAYAEIPFKVLKWAYDSFGEIALNRDERAARMVEEAIEVAQVEGVPLEIVQRITARVYSRPVGNLGQEIGGLMLGLYALAGNTDIDIHAEFEKEFARVKSKPRDWWTRKHAEKVEAGTADLSPAPLTNEEKTLWVPTAQVERMMRECRETDSFQIEVGIEVMKGLLADVLTWRKERLLHKPSAHAPSGCYCTERCAAPIVQGRQTPCRDPDKAARFKAVEQPSADQMMGRIAFRVEGDWWVAYYAMPDSMEGALELARIQMAIVTNHPQRKNTFMKLIQGYVKEIVPAFEITDQQPAPEHERSGRG